MVNVLKKSNLRVFDIEHINTHGGSIRYYVSKNFSKYKQTCKILKICEKEKLFKNKKNYKKFLMN